MQSNEERAAPDPTHGADATDLDARSPHRRRPRSAPGGTLAVPPEATLDTELATTTTHVPDGTLLVDVQNHLLDYVMHPDGADFTGFPQAACGEDDPRMCFSPEHWADLVFQQSDTTMAVLSAIPVVGAVSPLSIEAMEHGKQVAAELCGDGRVLIQGHAVPERRAGRGRPRLDVGGRRRARDLCVEGVHARRPGLVPRRSRSRRRHRSARRSCSHVEAIGVNVVAVHKGLSGGSAFASPVDIGPAAANHPGHLVRRLPLGLRELVPRGGVRPPNGDGVDRLIASVHSRPASGPAATCTPSSARRGGQ